MQPVRALDHEARLQHVIPTDAPKSDKKSGIEGITYDSGYVIIRLQDCRVNEG
jgi:hypothetical protein